MRPYLVSGYFLFFGQQTAPFSQVMLLGEGEVMNVEALIRLESTLLRDNNSQGTIAKQARVTSFQPLEAAPTKEFKPVKFDVFLNSPEVLPPVGCPLVIEIGGHQFLAERTAHIGNKSDDISYQLQSGQVISGRFNWTYP